jgi:hypothetical protein
MNRFVRILLLALVVLVVAAVPILAQQVATEAAKGTPVTPDVIKTFFDANAILIMFVWGIAHKYIPALKNLPNVLIPWFNLAGYILTRVGGAVAGVGVAHAAGSPLDAVPDVIGVLIGGFTSASWARLLYEGWGRAVLDRMLHPKKYGTLATD